MTFGVATLAAARRVIVMAAGEAKARVVAAAATDASTPLGGLHAHAGVALYVTRGAARRLTARVADDVARWLDAAGAAERVVRRASRYSDALRDAAERAAAVAVDEAVCDVALARRCALTQLTARDLRAAADAHDVVRVVVRKLSSDAQLEALRDSVRARLLDAVERGVALTRDPRLLRSIVHTAPHHDDLMLGYHPLLATMTRTDDAANEYVYFTSGFNSVTDQHVTDVLGAQDGATLEAAHAARLRELGGSYEALLDAFVDDDDARDGDNERQLLLYHAAQRAAERGETLARYIDATLVPYFRSKRAGDKDEAHVQRLKGAMRESESERMLRQLGAPLASITHLRTPFYTGAYFNLTPNDSDIAPLRAIYVRAQPSLITTAFDPASSGPDTHFKSLQVVAEALRGMQLDAPVSVLGYRNVWFTFSLGEVSAATPVDDAQLATLHAAFMKCFASQSAAAFPSHKYDGPFSILTTNTMRTQCEQLRTLLGDVPSLRAASGVVFTRLMTRAVFLESVRELEADLGAKKMKK